MALELQELDRFLASIERRAFQMAMVSVRNRDDALDVVQDAMTQLATRYGRKDPEQWRPIFFRILQNKALDLHRKRSIQRRIMGWLGNDRSSDEGDGEADFIEQSPAAESTAPHKQHEQGRSLEAVQGALGLLPPRQQQAFMLRCWEGMSTNETSIAMQCSEGSVKTHYSRALHSLRSQLGGEQHESI
jgi:RNA polymerase sigma-70 factor (ECF subfamily)